MSKQERLKDLFGSMSDSSDSPASPPPGAWPPPVDPSRRYSVPGVGTKIQRGDRSQRQHTRWMEETPPAPPRTGSRGRNQPAATITPGVPQQKAASPAATGTATTSNLAARASTSTAARPSSQARKVSGSQAAKAATTSKAGTTRDPRRALQTTGNQPGESGRARGAKPPAAAPVPILEIRSVKRKGQDLPSRRQPIFKEMTTIRPPRSTIPTVAAIEGSTSCHQEVAGAPGPSDGPAKQTLTTARAPDMTTTPSQARPRESRAAAAAGKEAGPTATTRGTATPLVLPLPPFAVPLLTSPAVMPPAPPAYVRAQGWTTRPRIPMAVPIQLPDGEYVSVPMSAIRHNRKWRARTSTGKWILRFAPDGRLTVWRKVQEATQ
ncbi:hypothetical protein PUN28_015762 [Cardiocondyla obscurior]|uniref:Uncharacterized protein n=1 Tax=Cardiocondyla obscurior TaxID=286306 RepID=A0AAW2EUK5_9HYME